MHLLTRQLGRPPLVAPPATACALFQEPLITVVGITLSAVTFYQRLPAPGLRDAGGPLQRRRKHVRAGRLRPGAAALLGRGGGPLTWPAAAAACASGAASASSSTADGKKGRGGHWAASQQVCMIAAAARRAVMAAAAGRGGGACVGCSSASSSRCCWPLLPEGAGVGTEAWSMPEEAAGGCRRRHASLHVCPGLQQGPPARRVLLCRRPDGAARLRGPTQLERSP